MRKLIASMCAVSMALICLSGCGSAAAPAVTETAEPADVAEVMSDWKR